MHVKCPKCQYLGFDTGARCRHCGYDFSLLALAEDAAASTDLLLRPEPDPRISLDTPWLDVPLAAPAPAPAAPMTAPAIPSAGAPEPPPAPPPGSPTGLPLFSAGDGDDEPLIRMPTSPRAPVAVRRTPEVQRSKLRHADRPDRPAPVRAHALDAAESLPLVAAGPPDRAESAPAVRPSRTRTVIVPPAAGRPPCRPGPRVAAAVLDLALLAAVDFAVLYFTLKMASLTMADWQALPAAPLVVFLVLLKFAYFVAFTAVGGQTIGKMAAHIRVVAEDDSYLEPARALQRTLVAFVSLVTLGAAFAPALVGPGRALHDRIARTRVVAQAA